VTAPLRLSARYCVRPQLSEGESAVGYCWRFFTANGHDVPMPIRGALRAARRLWPRTESRVGHNAPRPGQLRLNGIDACQWRIKHAAALASHFGNDAIGSTIAIESTITGLMQARREDRWLRWPRDSRFCPRCFAVGRHHAIAHDLPLVAACPTHGVRLVSLCTTCQWKLRWQEVATRWRCCACKTPLSKMETVEAAAWEQAIARAVSQAVHTEFHRAANDTSAGVSPCDNALAALYDALAWAATLHAALRAQVPEGPSPCMQDIMVGRPDRWEVAAILSRSAKLRVRAERILRAIRKRAAASTKRANMSQAIRTIAAVLRAAPGEFSEALKATTAQLEALFVDPIVSASDAAKAEVDNVPLHLSYATVSEQELANMIDDFVQSLDQEAVVYRARPVARHADFEASIAAVV
jgi:hypothetical protein